MTKKSARRRSREMGAHYARFSTKRQNGCQGLSTERRASEFRSHVEASFDRMKGNRADLAWRRSDRPGSESLPFSRIIPSVLPRSADQAAGRNRAVAAYAIAVRLRDLAGNECTWRVGPSGKKAGLIVGSLIVEFWINDSGLYFRIDHIAGGAPLMSGYIDPKRRGQYDNGHLQVMSWRRGWERQLFEPIS